MHWEFSKTLVLFEFSDIHQHYSSTPSRSTRGRRKLSGSSRIAGCSHPQQFLRLGNGEKQTKHTFHYKEFNPKNTRCFLRFGRREATARLQGYWGGSERSSCHANIWILQRKDAFHADCRSATPQAVSPDWSWMEQRKITDWFQEDVWSTTSNVNSSLTISWSGSAAHQNTKLIIAPLCSFRCHSINKLQCTEARAWQISWKPKQGQISLKSDDD